MDHETLKRMERAVLEELDGERLQDLQHDLAAHPEALERVRSLGRLTRQLRAMPPVTAPPGLAGLVTARLRVRDDSRRNAVRRHACRHCALLFGAAGMFYLLLAAATQLALRHLAQIDAVASGLTGQPVWAMVSGLVLLALAGLSWTDGPARLDTHRVALAGAVLHALGWAADGLWLMAAGSVPVAGAGLALAWTGLVAGALLADAARQSLGRPRACAPLGAGA